MSFRYFAYGSNMLSERMRVNCPSAVKQSIALLKDYKLTFTGFAETWKGSTAALIKKPGSEVWGVVWTIEKVHEDALEKQEFTYNPIMVNVVTPEHQELECKLYYKDVPHEEVNAKPSTVYKTVILNGAKEHNLPKDYINNIEAFEDNGYEGQVSIAIKNPLSNNTL